MNAQPHLGTQPSARRTITLDGDSIELLPRRPYEVRYTPDVGVIGFAFETQTGTHAFACDRRTAFRARPNSLAHLPAGCDVFSRSDSGGEYLTLKAKSGFLNARAAGRRFNDHIDAQAIAAAQRLRRAILSCDPDPLDVESCILMLQAAVARVYADGVPDVQAGRWMTAQRLKRVDEFIEAHLDERLSVRGIAAHLGLSAGFFSRAFKSAVGKAPHDYIVDRRTSRARVLLRTTQLGLAEIAASTGFASHAHMTAQFRNRLGATPSALRAC